MNRLLLKENLAKHYFVKNKRLHMQLFYYTCSSFVALFFSACRSRKNDHLLKAYFFVQKFGVKRHWLEELRRVRVSVNFSHA